MENWVRYSLINVTICEICCANSYLSLLLFIFFLWTTSFLTKFDKKFMFNVKFQSLYINVVRKRGSLVRSILGRFVLN